MSEVVLRQTHLFEEKEFKERITKSEMKYLDYEPPFIFVFQDNDDVLTINTDGSLYKLSRTVNSTVFYTINKQQKILIRGDSKNKLIFTMFKDGSWIQAMSRVHTSLLFSEKEEMYCLQSLWEHICFRRQQHIYQVT